MKPSPWIRLRRFTVLVAFKALGELRTDRQRTYLGFLWWFFEPVFFMLVYYFVFAVLLQRGGPNYLPVLLIGIILWRWFASSINHCANSVLGGLSLLRSVPVKAGLFPLATFVADSVKFLAVMVVLLASLAMLGFPPNLAWTAIPAVLLAQFPWVCGLSMIMSALVPFVPDLKYLIQPFLQALFFLSGVFFTLDSVAVEARQLLEFDPMAVIIDCARQILIHGVFPDPWRLARVFCIGMLVLGFSAWLLHRSSSRYAKLAD